VSARRIHQDLADPPRLHPADIEAIAVRVAALMESRTAPPARLVDAAQLASILGVERDWVYAHAKELEAVRLGGPRGRLRFDLAAVLRTLNGDPNSGRQQTLAPRGTRPMQLIWTSSCQEGSTKGPRERAFCWSRGRRVARVRDARSG
jgi:hypothetical protein